MARPYGLWTTGDEENLLQLIDNTRQSLNKFRADVGSRNTSVEEESRPRLGVDVGASGGER